MLKMGGVSFENRVGTMCFGEKGDGLIEDDGRVVVTMWGVVCNGAGKIGTGAGVLAVKLRALYDGQQSRDAYPARQLTQATLLSIILSFRVHFSTYK